MQTFIQKYNKVITGVLSGFDRLVFRGTLRQIVYTDGMRAYLSKSGVLLKDFAGHVNAVTEKLKTSATKIAESNQRPLVYLQSPGNSKEDAAKDIMKRDKITSGLVCIFTAVEPCISYDVYRDRKLKLLVLKTKRRKCLHVYHYWIDPIFGFMNARIQTWFPFNIQICINGREWLSRQMDKAKISYLRKDNCFPYISNVEKAQNLMNKQLESDWTKLLSRFRKYLNPEHDHIFQNFTTDYYWSVFQSEWATDIMFKNRTALDEIYPSLIHHGMTTFQSPDVMRFLGKKLTVCGQIHGTYLADVTSDLKIRHEGVRIKHRINGNSIKAYNKEGNILRIETTINEPNQFKVFRQKSDGNQNKQDWLPMRKGIADLKRRSDVSQAANERYIEAIAAADSSKPMRELISTILKPAYLNGNRFRPLNLWASEDGLLFEIIMRGEFSINGFRNRDIRALFFTTPAKSDKEESSRSGKISRLLRMLRAHGLIRKVPRTHRYQLTSTGRVIISAIIAAHNASAEKLTALAA